MTTTPETTETEYAISFDAACEWLRASLRYTDEQVTAVVDQSLRYQDEGRRLDLVAAEWDLPEYVVEALVS
jgi:hypothetical protein